MKTNRRDFLKKTGLVLGTTTISATVVKLVSLSRFDQSALDNKEQVQLLKHFENWVDSFTNVIKEEKVKNREFKDNQALTLLPDELEKWMPEIKKHLSDKQFATEYLKISNRLTQVIDHQF